ncbi:hypothetical protein [Streptomyces alfalfae]|uniref:Uncharacterized protein n=1 Tax=Streptomyces alfalfae TaxID=1642299 RepID=A0A7T4PLU5_9ACTN|nr:hypothetical protein [Streptomyces alfalfae]QQC92678.1 hypothetical protein I8755_33145 [Streptomyces alfalfae]
MGPLCPLCRQPDPGLPARQAARDEQLRKAKAASAAAEKDLGDLQQAAQKGVEARRKAEGESERLAGRVEAYRAKEITPREKALAQAAAAEAEARARLAEVKDRRKELVRIGELEKLASSLSKRADEAAKDWAAAEGDSQEHRQQTAKWLSQIFADLVIPMAPDKIRTAVIEPKTFAPKINNRSMKQLARSAGLVSLAHTAYHLMCLEAARTMPLVRLPAIQWLDAPLRWPRCRPRRRAPHQRRPENLCSDRRRQRPNHPHHPPGASGIHDRAARHRAREHPAADSACSP